MIAVTKRSGVQLLMHKRVIRPKISEHYEPDYKRSGFEISLENE
jgi:hypothetical protein